MFLLETISFAVPIWLGCYLLARNSRRALLRRAALGLLAYALALACLTLGARSGERAAGAFVAAQRLLIALPPLCWSGALLALLPEDLPLAERLDRLWRLGLVPLVLLLLAAAPLAGVPWPAVLAQLLAVLALLLALALMLRQHWPRRTRRSIGLLAVAGLFFGLSSALSLAPLLPLPLWLTLLAIGVDLELLGLAIALLDAFDEGETLPPHMLRSLLAAAAAAVLFGGLVAAALGGGLGFGPLAVALLLGTLAAAIAVATFADQLGALLDRLALARTPEIAAASAELREAAAALPRLAPPAPAELDEAEFARLTRRALSHYGDLPRLAASPLTRMPAVSALLAERGLVDTPLERAALLKELLAGSIARLKPREGGDFGTGDAWRHYNALFFPYVCGLKPYSTRASHNGLDPATREALNWLRAEVPERTLHNWQNAAARLVAQDLKTEMRTED
jgi:hypothetical protein